MIDVELLNEAVIKKGKIINAPKPLLVVHTSPLGDGTPHVEIKNGECFYVSSERGYEFFREKITNINELLFRIFDRITSRMASDYELENRIEAQDCRRLIFDKKLELLGKISPEWEDREREKIRLILEKNPYVDQ